jgi:hypothetical protein
MINLFLGLFRKETEKSVENSDQAKKDDKTGGKERHDKLHRIVHTERPYKEIDADY